MKKLTFLFLFIATSTFGQPKLQHLKFDNERYFYLRQPGARNNSVIATVDVLIPGVELVSTDNRGSAKLRNGQTFRNAPGRPFYLLAVPLLYEVSSGSNSSVYRFGPNGGENDFNSAEITISRTGAGNQSASPGNYIEPPVRFGIEDNELYSFPSSVAYNNQTYLKVNASKQEPATIAINREPNRGNTYVCIFNEKGNLLTALDPKNPGNNVPRQSFTTAENVYVIPVIGRKIVKENGRDRVVFEVGDPRESAVIEIFEE